MPKIRFTLVHLFLWTAIVAAGCAALKYPTPLVEVIATGGMSFLVPVGVTIAFLATGSRRVFWTAFSSFFVTAQYTLYLPESALNSLWFQIHNSGDITSAYEFSRSLTQDELFAYGRFTNIAGRFEDVLTAFVVAYISLAIYSRKRYLKRRHLLGYNATTLGPRESDSVQERKCGE